MLIWRPSGCRRGRKSRDEEEEEEGGGDGMLCRYYMVNTLAALHDRSFFFWMDAKWMGVYLVRDFFFGKFGSVKDQLDERQF